MTWFVVYSWDDDLWEYEKELCDRCVAYLVEQREQGLAHIWAVEEA